MTRVSRVVGTRWLRGIAVTGAVALASSAAIPAAANATVTPADAAATREYLTAQYQYFSALANTVSASIAGVRALERQIEGECRDVLAGAPAEGEPEPASATARQRGERARSRQQLSTLREELDQSLLAASDAPDSGALQRYKADVAPLEWSNPAIAALVRFDATEEYQPLSDPSAHVCADLRFWAASGYHRLSPASLAFEASMSGVIDDVPPGSLEKLLAPYEDAGDRALIARTKLALSKLGKSYATPQGFPQERFLRTLGQPENMFEKRERAKVLGDGSTASGERFTVRLEPDDLAGEHCRVSVDVEFRQPNGSGGGSSNCVSTRATSLPSTCSGEVTSIDVGVPASVTRVRLALKGGRTITSSVVHVPRRYGGPVGIYVQAVRGYGHYPLSLTELNAAGQTVRVVKFPARQRCHRQPAIDDEGPTFLTLVHGTAPGGEPFSLQGTLVHAGRDQTFFSVNLEQTPRAISDESSSGVITHSYPPSRPPAFETSLRTECTAHQFTAVFGILSPPGSAVLVMTPEGLVPLTELVLATKLHAAGPLFYGVFATAPTEVVVKRANGTTLYTESLATKAKEGVEYCEGYAEP